MLVLVVADHRTAESFFFHLQSEGRRFHQQRLRLAEYIIAFSGLCEGHLTPALFAVQLIDRQADRYVQQNQALSAVARFRDEAEQENSEARHHL